MSAKPTQTRNKKPTIDLASGHLCTTPPGDRARWRQFWERKPLAPPGGHGVAIADRVRRRELRAR